MINITVEGIKTLIEASWLFQGASCILLRNSHASSRGILLFAMVDIKLPGKKAGWNWLVRSKKYCQRHFAWFVLLWWWWICFQCAEKGASGYILKDSMPQQIIESLKDLSPGRSANETGILPKSNLPLFSRKNQSRLSELTDREKWNTPF